MRPTEILKQEHRTIEGLLNRLEWVAFQAIATRSLDVALASRLIDVLSVFAHRWHREKEEKHFFPLIEQRGVFRKVICAALLEEHNSGHDEFFAMESAWHAAAKEYPGAPLEFGRKAVTYVRRLREHLKNEERIVFPLGEASLSAKDRAALVAAFVAVESQDPAPAVHAEIQRLLGTAESSGATHARAGAA